MRSRSLLSLVVFGFLLISPVISFSLRAALNDSVKVDTAVSLKEAVNSLPVARQAKVLTMEINGAIGTVTDDRIRMAIERAEEEKAELLVIFLDTPGGFTKPTWSICKNILNANIPVCMYIAPSGARAGSAGVYMTYASHFAAMAPSTNIGAAHPVSGGGQEVDSVMNEKITNDAVAQIKAAAQQRGRNAEWAENAVRESVAITDNEALELHVIDVRAVDFDDLMAQLNGREIEMPLGKKTMHLTDVEREEINITFVHRVLDTITQPDIAFILFSIGSLGIMLELYNPGAILPGVVGLISLILAFYAFQTLPINYAGMALILLSMVFFIAEIKVVSHGLLTIGGLISLFFGGLMLIDTVDPILRVSLSVLITVVICAALGVAFLTWLAVRASKRKVMTGGEGLIGKHAEVRKRGLVYVSGALWRISRPSDFAVGSEVLITGVKGLTLEVKPVGENKEGEA